MSSDVQADITFVFGEDAAGLSADAAARQSRRKFVRGKDQLAVHRPEGSPTGHVLTALEAYEAFGFDALAEAVEYGSAVILRRAGAIESALKKRREELGLPQASVARAADLPLPDVERAEQSASALSIRSLERIAFALGLDERLLAYHPTAGADEKLAVRLRTLQAERNAPNVRLSHGTVLVLAEAASIVRVQSRLQRQLGIGSRHTEFEPSSDYGNANNRAWRMGYDLAERARQQLRLGDTPISSMRRLVDDDMGIPVIQADLRSDIAGATVAVTDEDGREHRGIVLNTVGQNRNPWVRRATLAHEFGHLLYDPDDRLERVRVDTYAMNSRDAETDQPDYVEQRANAFAIAFLAPLDTVRRAAPTPITGESIATIMQRFGLSLTSARYHVHNAHYQQYALPSAIPHTQPDDEWRAAEDFTADYFPIRKTPIERRGRFAGLVAAAYERGFISDQTAAGYLTCELDDFLQNLEAIRGIYPIPAAA